MQTTQAVSPLTAMLGLVYQVRQVQSFCLRHETTIFTKLAITGQCIFHSIWQQQQASLLQVKSYIMGINTTDELEANRRTLLLLRTKTYLDEAWTDTEFAAVRTIANGCPNIWGESVRDAREMLPSAEANTYPIDGPEPGCAGNGQRSLEQDALERPIHWRVWPNPANDAAHMTFPAEFTGQVDLLNTMGQPVQTNQISKEIVANIDLSALPNGIYVVRVTAPGSQAQSRILIVQH